VYDNAAAAPEHSRIQTDYCEVRDRIVSKETVSALREILSIDAFCLRQRQSIVEKVGQAIAHCILHLEDRENFEKVLNDFHFGIIKSTDQACQIRESQYMQTLVKLKLTYQVISSPHYKDKKNLHLFHDKERQVLYNLRQLLHQHWDENQPCEVLEL
jgi:hypothetical protein